MVMNISCKFEKASYNIFLVRAVTVKSLYTLRRRRRRHNEVKSIVSTGCYPVDTMNEIFRFMKKRGKRTDARKMFYNLTTKAFSHWWELMHIGGSSYTEYNVY